jgi:hypothetical protein
LIYPLIRRELAFIEGTNSQASQKVTEKITEEIFAPPDAARPDA